MDTNVTIEVPVEPELAAEVEALAAVHAGGDAPRFIRLLLLKALRPESFAAEMAASAHAEGFEAPG